MEKYQSLFQQFRLVVEGEAHVSYLALHLALGIGEATHCPMTIIPEMFNKTAISLDKIPPRRVAIEGGIAQNYYNHICHYITPADYEAAKKFVPNPEEYDFKKILNW